MRESPLPRFAGRTIKTAKLLVFDFAKQYQLEITFADGEVLNVTIAPEAVGRLLQ